MAELYFKVRADWEKVEKLREEVVRLEQQLKKFGSSMPGKEVEATEKRLEVASKEFSKLTAEAAKSAVEIGEGYRRKVYDASSAINDMTEKMIAQKGVIKDVEHDVRKLGESYQKALKKGNPGAASHWLGEYTAAKKSLEEEKAALFNLSQQQAEARLGLKRLRDEYALYRQDSKDNTEATDKMAKSMLGLGKKLIGVLAVKDLISDMIKVRGEFQEADTAIQTLLGSKEKADALMEEVREYAKISPLEFSDVTEATQMMLGFNIEAEKVPSYIRAIGDISMGNNQKFKSLTLAFSQMSSTGKLMGQDLNQMINAGFNPLQAIADKTGESISSLKENMSKGAISTSMVQQAFIDATSAGGKFYNMSMNASETINGQLSMLSDAVDSAFNKIGKQSEGAIMGSIKLATTLVENYETIGKVVTGLAAIYGTYKAAVMATIVIEQVRNKTLLANIKATKAYAAAQAALNSVMRANPYALVATAIIGIGTAMWKLTSSTSAAEAGARRHKEALDRLNESLDERRARAESLIRAIQDEAETDLAKVQAYQALQDAFPNIVKGYTMEQIAVMGTTEAYKKLNEERDKGYRDGLIRQKNESAERMKRLRESIDFASQNPQASGLASLVLIRQLKTERAKYDKTQEELDKYDRARLKAKEDAESKPKETYKEAYKKAESEWKAKKKAVEDAKGKNKEDYLKAVKEAEAAEEAFKNLGGKTGKAIEKDKKEHEEYLKGIGKLTLERKRAAQDMEHQVAEATIKAKEEGYYKTMALMSLEHKKEMETINRQKEDYLQKKKDAARFEAERNPNSNGKPFDPSTVTLSKEEMAQFDALIKAQEESYARNVKEFNEKRKEDERKTIQAFLKDYGSYEEKRIALVQEAEDKISAINKNKDITDIDREYQIKFVKSGLKEALDGLDFDELKKNINWEYIFGDLGNTAPEALRAAKEQLQMFIDTSKDLSPDQIKTVADAIMKLQDSMDLSKPIESMRTARIEYARARKEFDKYKKTYDEAKGKNDTKGMESSSGGMIKSAQKMTEAGNKQKKSFNKLMETVEDYSKALKEAGDIIGGVSGEMLGLAGNAVLAGVSMARGVDMFKTSLSNMEKSVAVLAIIEAALKAVQLITTMFGGSADTTLTDYVNTLDNYIKLLDGSISDLNSSMRDAKNSMRETISYYEQLVKLEKESATAIKSQSQTWLNSGAAKGLLGIGSSASEGVKIRKKMKDDLNSGNAEVRKFYQEGYDSLRDYYNKATGVVAKSIEDFGRMDFIWKLSDEDLVRLSEDTKALSLLGDTLGEAIRSYADKIQAVKDDELGLGEALLSVSWDDFYEDFVSMISDMDKQGEDLAKNFTKYVRDALIKDNIATEYKKQLQDLYKKAADFAKKGVLEENIDKLRREYEEYASSARNEVEAINKVTGYDEAYKQTATGGGFETMSQESAGRLDGRFTALQMSGEEIKTLNSSQAETLDILSLKADTLISSNIEIRGIADESRTLIANSYLELVQITENTGAIVKPIQQMQKDIAEVKKNTSNL